MIRVRITRARGSTPRDAGTEMFVGPDRIEGTIGGGQLEYMAIDRARQMLARGEAEAVMDVRHVADAVLHMASLPLDANVLFMTVMATKMPFVGRG
jgi:xanthine/CO dehydrogenase XdhC/CoxF family maturation factor